MPEILVQNEPVLGLVVLADLNVPSDREGRIVLAPAAEWHSDNRMVTVWRGPGQPDEYVLRRELEEMECRTVLVDRDGLYTCPPIVDELRELVEKKAEARLNEAANERFAASLSYMEAEENAEKFSSEVWALATCGESVAVNGEVKFSRVKAPRGYVRLTDVGGHWPVGEEETVDLDELTEPLAAELTEELARPVDQEDVRRALRKIYKLRPGVTYIPWSSDGAEVEVWIPRRALRKYEEEQELKAERQRIEESMLRAQEHNRMVEEQRRRLEERTRKIKRGGFPTPKDWSPRGHLPGER